MTAPDQHSGNLLRRHHGLQPAAHEILQPAAHEVFSQAPTKLVVWASHEAPGTTAKSPQAQLVAADYSQVPTLSGLPMKTSPRGKRPVAISFTNFTAGLQQRS